MTIEQENNIQRVKNILQVAIHLDMQALEYLENEFFKRRSNLRDGFKAALNQAMRA